MAYVHVYSEGPVALCACYPDDMPLDDVITEVNRQRPTGIRSKWSPALEPTFATGQPNPCPCNATEGRTHRLFHC